MLSSEEHCGRLTNVTFCIGAMILITHALRSKYIYIMNAKCMYMHITLCYRHRCQDCVFIGLIFVCLLGN